LAEGVLGHPFGKVDGGEVIEDLDAANELGTDVTFVGNCANDVTWVDTVAMSNLKAVGDHPGFGCLLRTALTLSIGLSTKALPVPTSCIAIEASATMSAIMTIVAIESSASVATIGSSAAIKTSAAITAIAESIVAAATALTEFATLLVAAFAALLASIGLEEEVLVTLG
jgi:hypothetical protein